MMDCNNLIDIGMVIRMTMTVVSLYVLSALPPPNKYLLLIIPVLLTILDELDNILIVVYKQKQCTKQFHYQSMDKIWDAISYVLVYLFFTHISILDRKTDIILLLFIVYRIVGVGLFYKTKDSRWLIVFFDFIKEFLLYSAIFGIDYAYIFPFMVCKIVFEYYYHTIHNPNKYI